MDQEYVSHWHPNLTINLVVDQTNWVYGQVPQPLDECERIFVYVIIYKNMLEIFAFYYSFRCTFLTWWKRI